MLLPWMEYFAAVPFVQVLFFQPIYFARIEVYSIWVAQEFKSVSCPYPEDGICRHCRLIVSAPKSPRCPQGFILECHQDLQGLILSAPWVAHVRKLYTLESGVASHSLSSKIQSPGSSKPVSKNTGKSVWASPSSHQSPDQESERRKNLQTGG